MECDVQTIFFIQVQFSRKDVESFFQQLTDFKYLGYRIAEYRKVI